MTSILSIRPPADEFPPAFAGYVAQAADGSILDTLELEGRLTLERLQRLDDAQASHRYGPGKWSIKEIVGHLADAERVFAYRAMTFARGDEGPLPSFDENAYVPLQQCDAQPMALLLRQLAAVRAATIGLASTLPAKAWTRRGVAGGRSISVRALLWVIVGHEAHHRRVLDERYGGARA